MVNDIFFKDRDGQTPLPYELQKGLKIKAIQTVGELHFSESRSDVICDLIKQYNFATLVTVQDNTPMFSHLPFLLDESKGERRILTAHMARANPQWRVFQNESEVTVLFQGPHAYVSPRWYEPQPNNVPTWNYAAIHVHGIPKILAHDESAFAAMQYLVNTHDPEWTLALSEKDRREMMREIIVFEITITRIDAKFKLSQNRSHIDQEKVATNLLRSDRQVEQEMGRLMKERLLRRVAYNTPRNDGVGGIQHSSQ